MKQKPIADEILTYTENASCVSVAPTISSDNAKESRSLEDRGASYVFDTLISVRAFVIAAGHLLLFVSVYWIAFSLRFDFAIPSEMLSVYFKSLPCMLVLKLCTFYILGNFHGWWRYVTMADLAALLKAATLSLIAMAIINTFIFPFHIPRVVLFLDFIISITSLGLLRSGWRLFREQLWPRFNNVNCRCAFLVGADHSAGLLAHQIHAHPQSHYRVRGFIDPEGSRAGSRMGGIPILGSLQNICELATQYNVTDLLIIAGSLPGGSLRSLKLTCDEAGLALKIIPPVQDLFNGGRSIPIRDLEINDLLRREPVVLDNQAIHELLEKRVVMVTGAGGSIGSEICRQLLQFAPRRLILVGRGENRIFFLERELRASGKVTEVCSRIADITDKKRMRSLFDECRPDVVFHAAAHKHVPLMEDNPGEAVKNNILGTQLLANLSHEYGVRKFVLISTDKAVRPTSIMGATKHLAERYVMALSQESNTRFMVTRFGNVLGSAGSVVPIFQEQIRHGGPITVTDQRMTRYFMTIPEASQLVLQAAAMGRGGEIYVLDMGEPVRIVDLAKDMIRLSGLPQGAIDIEYTGIRPGEKMHEELYYDDEEMLPTTHSKLHVAYHSPCTLEEVTIALLDLQLMVNGAKLPLQLKLQQLIPEYCYDIGKAPLSSVASIIIPPEELNDTPSQSQRPYDVAGSTVVSSL